MAARIGSISHGTLLGLGALVRGPWRLWLESHVVLLGDGLRGGLVAAVDRTTASASNLTKFLRLFFILALDDPLALFFLSV